ncbi:MULTISPECIES: signal peptidase I [Bacillaceae]|uniref:signal peptidase I n=1 Tax=Bacillaceae TaxID=186817 RepID=UPI000C78F30B|nr:MULTISPECIES: signal peptidase I [Bacillaceae]PLR67387.1 signal peptidase I [Bacillus sp. UMB0893]
MRKRYWFFTTVFTFLLIISIKNLIFVDYRVEGGSMQPTLEEGHELSINKVNHFLFDIKRFDIVVFNGPGGKDAYIKRVIGLPGDELYYKNDQLFINGKAIDEPYLKTLKKAVPFGRLTGDFTLKETTGKETIPKDFLFVIGDNRRISHDSRHFGLIHKDDVIGKVKE